ncbi:MAG: hypothetical protein LC800_01260 [Acidobacteria bacterium]|nr:hypothetical protein [Acidobacteriota bacterium]
MFWFGASGSESRVRCESFIRRAREEARDAERRARRGVFAGVWSARTGYLVAGALSIGLLYGWLQFSTDSICCGDFDGYYHTRWSQLLWQGARAGAFPPEFKWLPHTTLNARDYVDHHFLFHALQAPFVSLGETGAGRWVAARLRVAPDALGPKLSAWLFASLAVFSCFWLMVRHRVRYPLVWLVALLGCSAPFLFRMNMTKAMSVSIVLVVVGINLLFRRKYVWLLPLAFLFTLTYDMFVLLGGAAVIWAAVVWWGERRVEWRPVAWVAAGCVLGLVINPYFPDNVRLLYQHAVMKIGVADANRPRVGNEWYPYESWDFFRNCAVAFAAMLAGYVAFSAHDRRRAQAPLFFLVLSTILLVANAKWRRYAEFWPPFAVLFAAFSVDAALRASRSIYSRLPADVMDELRHFLDEGSARGDAGEDGRREARRFGWAVVAGVALCVPLGFNVAAETREIADSAPHADYRAGAEWLRANVPAGETVFNTDWDDFPRLFYYDPAHSYVSGLDPTYLYDRDPALSKLYEEITLGRERDPGPLIRERFGARYVFTDNETIHDQFYDAALDSGWFEVAYEDDNCTVLRIREQKGGPPPPADEPGGDDADPPAGDNDQTGGDDGPAS